MDLKARADTIFHNWRNLMMGTLGKGAKSAIESKLLFKFYNDGFISTSNSEQEEQTEKNMSFIAVYHKFT